MFLVHGQQHVTEENKQTNNYSVKVSWERSQFVGSKESIWRLNEVSAADTVNR